MAADDLYDMLEKFVNNYSHLSREYYIMVVVKNNYQGPAPFKDADTQPDVETTEMRLPDKMIHNRIIGPMFRAPLVRQLGSMLWRVNNRQGRVDLVYALPQDIPTLQEDSEGRSVEKVAQDAQGIPLIWS